MKKYWCAANWKLYKGPEESGEFIDLLLQKAQDFLISSCCQLVFYPQNFSCPIVAEKTKGTPLIFGAQNCYTKSFGAYTGENSLDILKSLGANTVLVGHSERRVLFGENDNLIAQKMQAAFQKGLIPLLCVGENQRERELHKTKEVITDQVKKALSCFDFSISAKNALFVVAYEPLWAISTGKVATLEMIEEVHLWIKDVLSSLSDFEDKIPLLYGGSVKPENAKVLAGGENIDGFLVGRASLDVESFLSIAQILNKSKSLKK